MRIAFVLTSMLACLLFTLIKSDYNVHTIFLILNLIESHFDSYSNIYMLELGNQLITDRIAHSKVYSPFNKYNFYSYSVKAMKYFYKYLGGKYILHFVLTLTYI